MAEKILNVRIANKYDSYTNWYSNGNEEQILKKGEIAFITVTNENDQTHQPPAVLMRVGDGVHALKDLPYLQALSADTYDWARQENPPTYTASDIEGLEDYVKGNALEYRIQVDETDSNKYNLQSCPDSTVENPVWTTVSTFTIPEIAEGTTAGTIKVGDDEVKVAGWDELQTDLDDFKDEVNNEIASKIASVYTPAGSITFADLTAEGMLDKANIGKVYNVSDAFTTTEEFIGGAGQKFEAGTNVVIVNDGTDEAPEYRYDTLAATVDLSNYWTAEQTNTAIENAIDGLEITTDKITDFTEKVTETVNTEITKELGEGETSELQTTIKEIAGNAADEKIAELDYTDVATDNTWVTKVDEIDGVISVSRSGITLDQINDVAEGNSVILSCGGANA